MTTPRLTLTGISPDALAEARASGRDPFGNTLQSLVDAEGGAPLRCCLRRSRPGEQITLMAWSPFPWGGHYAEVGPVFVHADACSALDPQAWPKGYLLAPQAIRAYGAEHSIMSAAVLAPDEVESGARRMLEDGAEFVHVRNAGYGCWLLTVTW